MSLNNAQLKCEDFLQEQIRRNEAEDIVPSESEVARNMLSRGLELRSVYQELERSLGFDGIEWKVFLEFCVLATGAHWTPEKNIADRSARKRLDKVNEAIAGLADHMAELLEEREQINNRGPFSSDTLYHPVEVIDRASECNGHYKSFLKERLENLCQFDLKYWPSLSEMIRAIGTDAENANVHSHDPARRPCPRPHARPWLTLFEPLKKGSRRINTQAWVGFLRRSACPMNRSQPWRTCC